LRDTDADHRLLEFKYTEGRTGNAFVQWLSYDYFYRRHRRWHATMSPGFASRRSEQKVSFRVLQPNELLASSLRIERLLYSDPQGNSSQLRPQGPFGRSDT
jgi:hypothetical protein